MNPAFDPRFEPRARTVEVCATDHAVYVRLTDGPWLLVPQEVMFPIIETDTSRAAAWLAGQLAGMAIKAEEERRRGAQS